MKNPTALPVCLLLTLLWPATDLAAQHPPDEAGLRARLANVERYCKRLVPYGFAGVVLVTEKGTPRLTKAYGLAHRKPDVPMSKRALMTTGSLTKQFTAVAIARLVVAGKLRLDATLDKFFGSVPEDKRGITVRHLLTHGSGLPGAVFADHDARATRDRVLAAALAARLRFEPGTDRSYSNVGYSLLAMILEKLTGQGYEQHLAEALFEPAGMRHTGYVRMSREGLQLPTGYRNGGAQKTFVEDMGDDGPNWALRGNGGILTTIADIACWERELRGDGKLEAAVIARLTKPLVTRHGAGYGYGWGHEESPWGEPLMEHDGGNGVFHADYHRYLESGISIYVMTSVAEFSALDLTSRIADLLFGRELSPPPAVIAPTRPLESYAGRFRLPSGAVLPLTVSGKTLRAALPEEISLAALVPDADPAAARSRTRALAWTRAWTKGDFGPLRKAMGGGPSLADLRNGLGGDLRDQTAERGPLRGVRPWITQRSAGGHVVPIELRHARGSWLVIYTCRDGRVTGIDIEGELDAPRTVVLHPCGPHRFAAFDLGLGLAVVLTFDASGDSFTLGDRGGEWRARRTK